MLFDYNLHAIGVTDSSTTRREFRTPTLKNLKHTAPYMHHGSIKSVAEVLMFDDQLMDHVSESLKGGAATSLPPLDPLLRNMNLLPEYHELLATYLDAMNSNDYDKTVAKHVLCDLPVAGIY